MIDFKSNQNPTLFNNLKNAWTCGWVSLNVAQLKVLVCGVAKVDWKFFSWKCQRIIYAGGNPIREISLKFRDGVYLNLSREKYCS